MSKEKLAVDFKLARFTRLLAGPAEMTKSKGNTSVMAVAVLASPVAPMATAQTVTSTAKEAAANKTVGARVEQRRPAGT
jgi:hypothetical protein